MIFKEGRQKSGYLKLKLAEWKFFDLYILKYPTGSMIPPHRDPVPGKKHYRINFELKKAKVGGTFKCETSILKVGRLAIFRSDISTHEVSLIEKGTRYVLSLGLAFKDKAFKKGGVQ